MTRKKDLSIEKLKEHVIDWWVDRVHHDQEIVRALSKDESIPVDEKEMIFGGIANGLQNLLDLVDPIVHDEDDLLDWMEEFIDEYSMPDPEDEIEN